MRKNGINRELRPIAGGVCAPNGFRANGIHCGIEENPSKKDLALIVAERRCPTACVFSEDAKNSVTSKISKRIMRNGLASAIIVNSGIANLYLSNGEELAVKICRFLATSANVDAFETVIASTGKIGRPLTLTPFKEGIPLLVKGLEANESGSLRAAEAIMTTDKMPKQLSFSFDIGDVSCKIGAIFKGNTRVSPNLATTLAFLTTDVSISSKMLQKALGVAVRDTFNLLCVDGISSPNDMVCIMANGQAGNYMISQEDVEYSKFTYILKEVMAEICRRIATDGDSENRLFICRVSGAKSKLMARSIAKTLVSLQTVRDFLLTGKMEIESILFAIDGMATETDFSKVSIWISAGAEYALFEDGRVLGIKRETLLGLLKEKEIALNVFLDAGNYSATAYGSLQPISKCQ